MKVVYKRKDRFFLFGVIAALVCSALTFSAYRSGVSSVAARLLGYVVTPIQSLATGIHTGFDSAVAYFRDIDSLRSENERLKEEVLRLEREVSELEPTKKENEMLSAFLGLKRERSDMKFVSATVIGRSYSNYTSEFTVDKGRIHGLQKNMPVMSEDNTLLGVLIEVGSNYARGKTITSYDVSVGVKNERTGQPAIASGSLSLERRGLCEVRDLDDTADWQVGDTVRTSGFGGVYPSGLYVGTVTELVPNPLEHTVSAIVEPSHSVYDTELVMIITDAGDADASTEAVTENTENESNEE